MTNAIDLGPWGFADPGETPEGKHSPSEKKQRGSQKEALHRPCKQNSPFLSAGCVCFPEIMAHIQEYADHTRGNKQKFIFL